jgi:nitroreductase
MGVMQSTSMRTLRQDDGTTIKLPTPFIHGSGQVLPFMDALQVRHTTRAFSSEPLPEDILATLVWAATGINRPDTGGRTAPSAHGWNEIDVYAALPHGLYRYDVPAHALTLAVAKDIRPMTGVQDFVSDAPLNLVYVADFSRMTDASEEDRKFFAATDAAVIGENVYLFCAATGLATVLRGLIDRKTLAAHMQLRPLQRIILAQTVGFPKGW